MPAWSPPIPSSRCEQHMPQLGTPRSFDFLILRSPGSTAPTVATGTLMPAAMFGAPHTICTGSPAPTSTVTTCRWSLSGCSSQVSTCPTTTPSSAAPVLSTASTPVPVRSSRSQNAFVSEGTSTYSLSHFKDTFISFFLSSMRVAHTIPNHSRPSRLPRKQNAQVNPSHHAHACLTPFGSSPNTGHQASRNNVNRVKATAGRRQKP